MHNNQKNEHKRMDKIKNKLKAINQKKFRALKQARVEKEKQKSEYSKMESKPSPRP